MKNNVQSIKVHLPQLRLQLDPHTMEDTYSYWCVVQLYRGLFRYLENGVIKPDLVESWKELDSGHRLQFSLKPGLKFSDGTPIIAADFVRSLARLFRKKAAMAVDLGYIRGVAEFVKTGKLEELGVKALNSSTIEMSFSTPSSLVFKHLATSDMAILPVRDSRGFEMIPGVYSGPFRVEQQDEVSLNLVKWRGDSFDSTNPPGRIEVAFLDTRNSEKIFADGMTDVFDRDILSDDFQLRLIAEGWKRSVTEITRERFVILNPSRISLPVRTRLFDAVDSEKLVDELKVPQFKAAFGIIPDGLEGSLHAGLERKSCAKSDPEITNAMTLVYPEEFKELESIALRLNERWVKCGISNVKLEGTKTSDWVAKIYSGDYDLVLASKGIDYPDGMAALGYFRSISDDNFFHVKSIKVDKMIDGIHALGDDAKRAEQYKNIQLEILKLYTYVPLASGSSAAGLWSTKIDAVPPHPYGFHTLHFESITLKR